MRKILAILLVFIYSIGIFGVLNNYYLCFAKGAISNERIKQRNCCALTGKESGKACCKKICSTSKSGSLHDFIKI